MAEAHAVKLDAKEPKAILLKEIAKVESTPQLTTARFSPCGQYLFGASYDATIQRWKVDEKSLNPLPPLEGHGGWVSRIVFGANDKRLYSADTWGQLRCWNCADQNPTSIWANKHAHDGWIRDIALSGDGKRLATCGRDRMVRVWTSAGKLEGEFEASGVDVHVIAMHPDGEHVASGDMKGNVTLWNLISKKPVTSYDASSLYKYDRIQDVVGMMCLQFHDEGRTLLAAGTSPTRGATVQGTPTALFFDTASAKLKHTFAVGQPKDGHITDVVRLANDLYLAVTSGVPGNGRIVIFQPGDDKPRFENTKIANCHGVARHPDGKRLAVCATNRGSNGNGRRLNKDGEYEGNHSPIHLFSFWVLPDS